MADSNEQRETGNSEGNKKMKTIIIVVVSTIVVALLIVGSVYFINGKSAGLMDVSREKKPIETKKDETGKKLLSKDITIAKPQSMRTTEPAKKVEESKGTDPNTPSKFYFGSRKVADEVKKADEENKKKDDGKKEEKTKITVEKTAKKKPAETSSETSSMNLKKVEHK